MCTVLLPPGVNLIAVNKYINNTKWQPKYNSTNYCKIIVLYTKFQIVITARVLETNGLSPCENKREDKKVAQVAVCSQINTKHINTVWAERTVVEC